MFVRWSGSTQFVSAVASNATTITMPATNCTLTALYQLAPVPVITGRVVRSGTQIGVAGVTVQFSNGGGTATTDTNGTYQQTLPYLWFGTATPTNSAGGAFTPATLSFTNLTTGEKAQNFIWYPAPFISGKVTLAGSLSGVTGIVITCSGVGYTNTDSNGNYAMTVPYNWTGTVTPSSTRGGTFSAASKSFSRLTVNLSGQNFVWTAPHASIKPAIAPVASSVPVLEKTVVIPSTHVVLLRTFGSARWTGAAAKLIRSSPELLAITKQDTAAEIILPVAVAEPGDLQASVVNGYPLPTAPKSIQTEVLVIRNVGGNVVADALLPGTSAQGTVNLTSVGDDVVLSWSLQLITP